MMPEKNKDEPRNNILIHQTIIGQDLSNDLISIVIPFKKLNPYVLECISNISFLNYTSFEIILLPDEVLDEIHLPKMEKKLCISIIPTGPVPPGVKRNIGTSHAKGSIIAFIDDDAYPDQNWLNNAIKLFHDPTVAAVGGPNLTPPSDGIMQRAGGLVLQSWIGGGGFSYRYKSRYPREDDDLPTVNLLIRRDVLNDLGGFEVKYYPGDDTYLCLQITKKLHKKIIYSPDVIVYHHRRPLFIPHMRQIWNYGKHRGYFAKKFPETSRKPLYFAPSVLVLSIILSPILLLLPVILSQIYFVTIAIYLVVVTIEAIKTKNLKLFILFFIGILATHVSYGVGFLKGLLSKKLTK